MWAQAPIKKIFRRAEDVSRIYYTIDPDLESKGAASRACGLGVAVPRASGPGARRTSAGERGSGGKRPPKQGSLKKLIISSQTTSTLVSITTRHFIVDVPGGLQAHLEHMTRSHLVVSVPWKKENYKDPAYTTRHRAPRGWFPGGPQGLPRDDDKGVG